MHRVLSALASIHSFALPTSARPRVELDRNEVVFILANNEPNVTHAAQLGIVQREYIRIHADPLELVA